MHKARIQVGDLSPSIVRCMSPADRQALGVQTPEDRIASITPASNRTSKTKAPTKTEHEYNHVFLAGRGRFEAITFRLANGHRYTPDFITVDQDGQITCHEVKGAYKLGSYQRARLAFDQARIEWPTLRWVWAEKTDKGWSQK